MADAIVCRSTNATRAGDGGLLMIEYQDKVCIAFRYEAGNGEPHRICYTCARLVTVSRFGKDREGVKHTHCLDCHRIELQRRDNARRCAKRAAKRAACEG